VETQSVGAQSAEAQSVGAQSAEAQSVETQSVGAQSAETQSVGAQSVETQSAEAAALTPAFVRRAIVFVAIGVLLYGALYAAAEALVYRYADRNRFFQIRTAPPTAYDHVILGASHAAVFDFGDMNARLEQLAGARILNLSVVGGGIRVNRLLLDYFFSRHTAGAVVYVVDSFAFYSPEWNEQRLEDARLFHRAPFDPTLARLLARSGAGWTVTLDYVTGFSKINNPARFAPDQPAEAARFDRRYRPIEQIDRQRIEYLYPPAIDAAAEAQLTRYLAEFEALIAFARARGAGVILIRPPLPPRTRPLIPGEAQFDQRLAAVAARAGARLHDLSAAIDDPAMYFDSDHLNRSGVSRLFEEQLTGILQR
jgi:hypothetical protein